MDTRTSLRRLRIDRLRDAMARHGVAAVLVPSADPHLSEYLPERWQAREWFSGFTGSAGTLIVTADEAALFADSRYWQQAETQLAGSGIDLVKIPTGGSQAHIEWIAERLGDGDAVAVDAHVLGLGAADTLRSRLANAAVALRTDVDVVDDAWPDRPAPPSAPVYEHTAPAAPHPRADKLAAVRADMARLGATHHLISTVDDIAWLLNLRGSDVSYNPVFLAHVLIDAGAATLFVGAGKIDPSLAEVLGRDGVRLADYAGAGDAVAALPADTVLLLDPRRVTLGLRQRVPAGVQVREAINPSTFLKSRKSDEEAAHIRRAMEEDGAAMCAFYAWFEAALGHERITELTIDERLSAERAKRPGFVGLSFPTIAGYNANGAMPHYRAMPDSHAVIEGDGLLLIDSGGQYLGGTTDITRVWPIGQVTDAQRRDYTLVLKGMIALSRMHFPRGTPSPLLDIVARAPLWQHGLDYGHGTGHGVGYFLNVHEGPQTISKASPEPQMAMEPGMVTSNEPGLYRAGQWGIRIENLVLNVPYVPDAADAGHGEFLQFETLTLCPIDTRCIDASFLQTDEIAWLDAYHATVRERLGPLVGGAANAWLEHRTRPLRRTA